MYKCYIASTLYVYTKGISPNLPIGNYDNNACNGGLPSHAFEYILENGGLDTEKSYPYRATGPNKCMYKRSHTGATVQVCC